MRSLGVLTPETLKTSSSSPWIWLYQGTLYQNVSPTPSPTFYLTSLDQPVTFDGDTYHPFPITHEAIESNSVGDLPKCQLTFSNVTREYTRYLVLGRGMVGQTVYIRLVHQDHLADPDAKVEWAWEVKGAAIAGDVVTLTLELPDFWDAAVPTHVFARDRCRWRYKDPETCGYVGDMPTCDKTLLGPLGCLEHGLDELAEGRPIRHPRLFGAFPGIPPAT